jgi:choline dehydrogenase
VTSPSGFDPPRISPDYLSTEEDRRVAIDALRLARRLVAQPALAAYRPQELKPGPECRSDEELLQAAAEVGTTIFHPVGTTRMGRSDDRDAVVDARLRVRGVAGLRIADAGVMPTITSGNTASPVLMIAEKAARWILQA